MNTLMKWIDWQFYVHKADLFAWQLIFTVIFFKKHFNMLPFYKTPIWPSIMLPVFVGLCAWVVWCYFIYGESIG